jgi:hypothetical protein
MEMQEYMKELFDWQKSIKKKERAVASRSAAGDAQPSAAPGPRGRASGAVAPESAALMQPALGPKGPSAAPRAPPASKPQQSASNSATENTAATHTYTSYGKWDKFDVDAALASDDEDDKAAATSGKGARLAAAAPAAASSAKPNGSSGGKLGNGIASGGGSSSSGGSSRAPAASASADVTASVSAPSTRSGGITISATDPGVGPSEDLLKPVSTTRLAKPAVTPPAAAVAPAADGGEAPAEAVTLPPIRNSQPTTADAWRARGNDLFKAGQYDSAYECYKRSVDMQPTCLGHANRAMALLKLGRWQVCTYMVRSTEDGQGFGGLAPDRAGPDEGGGMRGLGGTAALTPSSPARAAAWPGPGPGPGPAARAVRSRSGRSPGCQRQPWVGSSPRRLISKLKK